MEWKTKVWFWFTENKSIYSGITNGLEIPKTNHFKTTLNFKLKSNKFTY